MLTNEKKKKDVVPFSILNLCPTVSHLLNVTGSLTRLVTPNVETMESSKPKKHKLQERH